MPAAETLQWQAILAVGLHDPGLATGLGDGQLCSPFGELGQIHDFPAQFGITGWSADIRHRPHDIALLHLAPRRGGAGLGRGGREPERLRVQLQQPRRLRSGVAELKTQLDGGQLRRRPRDEQVAVAHRVQRAGAAKGAADLVAANRFAHVVHHDERGVRSVAQPQQRLAQCWRAYRSRPDRAPE